MKKMFLGQTGMEVPVIAVGMMRLSGLGVKDAAALIDFAIESGANFFDHADIYGGGECEEIFAAAVDTQRKRDKLLIQSKCGIHKAPGGTYFDFSKEHILSSVDGILKRLKSDYLDVLLLHRPDALVEPEEVAEAFDILESSGKVRHFGVSNQNPAQIELLKRYVRQTIAANQLQMSVMHTGMVDAGINVNMKVQGGIDRDGGILDYCRLSNITVQPWSPFQYGFFEGAFIDNPKFPELNGKLKEIAEKYGVTSTAIAIAWLLRHPAKMQPVTGTTNISRLNECFKATEIVLSREEWYAVYCAAGNILP